MADLSIDGLAKESGYDPGSDNFLLHILETVLRPKFSTSAPSTVTPQGRKAINIVRRPAHEAIDNSNEPWRAQNVLNVFAYAVEKAEKTFVEQYWHLFVPPLLTILDDLETTNRAHGLHILGLFLIKAPAVVLRQSGIGEVFEDAVMPTLLLLPGLTPAEESVKLLLPAYNALLLLAEVRFRGDSNSNDKMTFLSRVMREGILHGFFNCKDHVQIVVLLLNKMNDVVRLMGIHAVLHLASIVPQLSIRLSDPFSIAQPHVLIASLATLQTVMLNCWPRMSNPAYYVEIIKALTLCWANIKQEDNDLGGSTSSSEFEKVRELLRVNGDILAECLKGKVNLNEQLLPLLEIEPDLTAIFFQH